MTLPTTISMVLLLFLGCASAALAQEETPPLPITQDSGFPLLWPQEACFSDASPAAQACRHTSSLPWPPLAEPAPETTETSEGSHLARSAPGKWRWRRANGWEYAATAGALVSSLLLDKVDPETPKWSSRNDFDEGVRNALRLGGESDRQAMYTATDAVMGLMIAAPAIDAFATLGYRDRDWDALYQTVTVDVESFAFTSLVAVLLQTQLARERPFVRNCRDGHCDSDEINRSMPSGHAAYAFTSAGLLCTNHEYQGTYGNRETERTVCATALGLASVEGVLRIMADAHYASDVLAGTALGLFSGFLLPRLLHYWHPAPAEGTDKKNASRQEQRRLVIAPTVLPGSGAGIACRYDF